MPTCRFRLILAGLNARGYPRRAILSYRLRRYKALRAYQISRIIHPSFERTLQSARNQCVTNVPVAPTAKWVVPAGKNSHVLAFVHAQNASMTVRGARKRVMLAHNLPADQSRGSGGVTPNQHTSHKFQYVVISQRDTNLFPGGGQIRVIHPDLIGL